MSSTHPAAPATVYRLDLGDGWWVDLLVGPGVYDRTAAPGAFASEFARRLVEAAISDWNLTDENEQLLPLHPASEKSRSVGRLPTGVYERIQRASRELREASVR